MTSIKESQEKPSIEHFKLGRSLGEGNFSRIMLATHVVTGESFALKAIEKQRIKQLRVRHPNIFNEINMEKEVLNKLRHPNIVRLYHTFQDEVNLYFLLEHIEGGELLEQLVHEGKQIGVHEDLARFYLADVVNAIEYLHKNQIIHRDLKPENMVVSKIDGHLKLIDFGTAKDLGNTALNGPNFVGTPEYMPPETINNKDATYASDVWAFGCIVFQMLAGDTPFSCGSAYLTFLKAQTAKFNMPEFLSDEAKDLISKCLRKEPEERLTIDEVKAHPFFSGVDFRTQPTAPCPTVHYQNTALLELVSELQRSDQLRKPGTSLSFSDDLQIKIMSLSDRDRSLLMHLLERKQLLHLPSIFPRFFASASHGRCMYARYGGYVGLTHGLQNQWSDAYSFLIVPAPGARSQDDPSSWEMRLDLLRKRLISLVNREMPAFVVICGDAVDASPLDPLYQSQVRQVQEVLNEIHPVIKLVFMPGKRTLDNQLLDEERASYRDHFGDDNYCFWHGGVKFIVINSALLARGEVDTASELEDWLRGELENGKLCAKETVLFTAHSFHSLVQGPELPPHLADRGSTADSQHDIPTNIRNRVRELLGTHPVRLIVTTEGPSTHVLTVQTTRNQNAGDDDDDHATLKKTEMIVCGAYATTGASVYVANVTQSSIAFRQISAFPAAATTKKSAPEEINQPLSTEDVKLEIHRDVATTN